MKYVQRLYLIFLILFCLLLSCKKEQSSKADTEKLFQKLHSTESGITFNNRLIENDSLNYFTYAYIYMGGGVSAGDINNDGLIDLFFTGNMVPNKLYLNKGDMKFQDITDKAGILGDDRWYTGTTMADVNNDGYLDIYCSVGGKFGDKRNQLFINNKDNTFTESAKSYGLDDNSNSVQATFFDYDKDGDLDLYIANYPPTPFDAPNYYYAFKQMSPKVNETDKLFRNDEGHFTDVTEESGIKNFGLSLSATVADLNNDNWPDIYVSCDFSTPDFLYINNRDGTFSEILRNTTKNTSFYGMGVDIADFNNDHLPDILQVDMTPQSNRRSKANMASMNPNLFWSTVNAGFHYQYMQNSLQMNNGNLKDSIPDFSNVSRIAGVSSTDWSWGPLFSDFDNDGLKDIFISNGTRREINNRDFFLALEKKEVLKDSSLAMSLAIPSEKIENFTFKNNGDLTFKDVGKSWGLNEESFANGCLYADLDNDGDLDIVINNIDQEATIYQNQASKSSNSIAIEMKGPKKNPFGLGTKVSIYHNNKSQYQEMTLTRGFQSSVAPRLHFGIDKDTKVDSLIIIWTDDKKQKIFSPEINRLLVANHDDATSNTLKTSSSTGQLFSSFIAQKNLLEHRHLENDYNDFIDEILLPHQTSRFGPCVGVGDLNGDGTDDLVVGGAKGFASNLYIQDSDGFHKQETPQFTLDKGHEDLGIHLFDPDNDNDLDIYVVSGGNEFSPQSKMLQDRLYINDGNGNFTKSSALPDMLSSGYCVTSFDFDNDGDLDLFVGGRLVPGSYPKPADSFLLENRTMNGKVEFVDITDDALPNLKKIGMVTDAIWADIDNDGLTDLIVVGEWMNINIFRNEGSFFTDITDKMGLNDTRGWWFSIKAADFDNDGDLDLLAGNLGLNYKYKADNTETFDIYYNDFDNNEQGDIVLSYYNEGKKYPVRGRECSSQQMPNIKQKFKDYESFSTATLTDVYQEEFLNNSLHYQIKSFASALFENQNGRFTRKDLQNRAQLSSINQISVDDYDRDGNLDALIAGNLYSSEVETPRNDASIGLFLKGDGAGNFISMTGLESGFVAYGDVKDMAKIKIGEEPYLVVSKNSDSLQFIRINHKPSRIEELQ